MSLGQEDQKLAGGNIIPERSLWVCVCVKDHPEHERTSQFWDPCIHVSEFFCACGSQLVPTRHLPARSRSGTCTCSQNRAGHPNPSSLCGFPPSAPGPCKNISLILAFKVLCILPPSRSLTSWCSPTHHTLSHPQVSSSIKQFCLFSLAAPYAWTTHDLQTADPSLQ